MNNISRYISIAVLVLIVLFLLNMVRIVVVYTLVAWALSLAGLPIMQFIQQHGKLGKFKINSGLAAALTLMSFGVIIGLFILIFVPLLVEQISNLATIDYQSLAISLEAPITSLQDRLAKYGIVFSTQDIVHNLQNFIFEYLENGTVAGYFANILSTLGSILMATFSIAFITFFFLKEEGLFMDFLKMVIPDKYEPKILEALDEVTHLLSRYFSGILLQITIIAIYVSLLLHFLGVGNAILIGLFAAVINVIPYIGPIIGAIFGIIITITSHLELDFYEGMLPLLAKVVVVFASMQLIDNFVLQPTIFSKSIKAHPLEIFIVILVGAQLNGIPGMVLAIPTYTVLRVIAAQFLMHFEVINKLVQASRENQD